MVRPNDCNLPGSFRSPLRVLLHCRDGTRGRTVRTKEDRREPIPNLILHGQFLWHGVWYDNDFPPLALFPGREGDECRAGGPVAPP